MDTLQDVVLVNRNEEEVSMSMTCQIEVMALPMEIPENSLG